MQFWDKWHECDGPKYPHEKAIQFTFRNFAPAARAGTPALDLGCGSGVNTWFLAREGFSVSGTDVSAVGLDNTRRRLSRENLDADLRLTPSVEQPFGADTFDLVLCIRVLEVIPALEEQRRLVSESARVLKSGGRGLFLFASQQDYGYTNPELNSHVPFYPPDEPSVRDMFERAFTTVEVDRYITTYNGGRHQSNHFLVSVAK